MSGIDDLASTVVQESQAAAVYRRIWIVSAVNAGPPVSVNLKQTAGGPTVATNIRISASYAVLVPAVNDAVYVLITQSGGSGRRGGRVRGGDAFVVDKVAV